MGKKFMVKKKADPQKRQEKLTRAAKVRARIEELNRRGFRRYQFVIDQKTFDRFVAIHCQHDDPNTILGKIIAQYAGEEFRKPPTKQQIELAIQGRQE